MLEFVTKGDAGVTPLTLSALSGTTVPHQVASKTTAPTSPRLTLANQISFPSHVDG